MAHCTGICGIDLDCGPLPCGIFCTSDCKDCTQWCGDLPTLPGQNRSETVSPGVLVRVTRPVEGPKVRVRAGDAATQPYADVPQYPDGTEFRLTFNNLSRAALAHLLSSMHTRTIRPIEANAAERISGSATGTVAEIAAKFALVLE